MLIIDSHAHIFPYLGGKSGYSSAGEHLTICQRGMAEHFVQSVRRVKDNSIVQEKTLWDPTNLSLKGRYDVNFRVGEFGRFEWTKDGVDYYIQYLPPSLQDMVAPPGLLKAMMDYAGIDKAVLQCGGTYGNLNYYYAMVLDEYPELADSFIALARVNEKVAYDEEQVKRLRNAIGNLGLKGLWFAADEASFETRYKSFWDEVRDLDIPIFWAFYPKKDIWLSLLEQLGQWMEDYPSIPCVLPQAFPLSPTKKDSMIEIPSFAKELIKKREIYVEIACPIARGRVEDYPYPISRKAIKKLYDAFGAHKLVWGSDVPMVERYCTYPQSLNYLKDYCDFIPREDMELILGKNLQKMFFGKGKEEIAHELGR